MSANERVVDLAERMLVEKGVNPTAMRLLVLRVLMGRRTAAGVSELEEALGRADRITVYRTVKTFLEHGIVHQIDDGSGAPKYSLCEDDCGAGGHEDRHVHFRCRVCGETRCLDVRVELPVLPEGFRGEEMNVTVGGVCARCG